MGWYTADVRPAAVEQAGDSVSEQRAASRGPGDHLGRLHDVGRQDVDEVLSESPDRGRMPEQLVRVQVHTSVVSVAVVEVPVDHQDFELLQVFQRTLATLGSSIHQNP
jgi:hypothetical protein